MSELFKCTRCGIIKPQHDYYHSDGYRRRQCIECKKEDSRSRRNVKKEGVKWQAKQSPWISVEERFPENKETVLVSSQIYGKIVLAWDELGMVWLYPESEDVYCDWDNVDCWMPIPETP